MRWFTYILLCDQKTYYVGLTHDVAARLHSHQGKMNIATKEFSDIRLIYSEKYQTREKAERREKQLKGWSIAKKKGLIQGNLEELKRLSRSPKRVEKSAG